MSKNTIKKQGMSQKYLCLQNIFFENNFGQESYFV